MATMSVKEFASVLERMVSSIPQKMKYVMFRSLLRARRMAAKNYRGSVGPDGHWTNNSSITKLLKGHGNVGFARGDLFKAVCKVMPTVSANIGTLRLRGKQGKKLDWFQRDITQVATRKQAVYLSARIREKGGARRIKEGSILNNPDRSVGLVATDIQKITKHVADDIEKFLFGG